MSPVRSFLALAATAALFPPSPAAAQCQVRLSPGDGVYDSWFAESVSLSGGTALIGANHYDLPDKPEAGAAYVFVLEDGVWSEQALLFASDAEQWAYFGGAVALSGDTAVIGAHRAHPNGAAYVFVRSGTSWVQRKRLQVPGSAYFGTAVTIEDGTILVGDPLLERVHVYVGAGGSWALQTVLEIPDVDGSFGKAVALAGDTALIGAPNLHHSGFQAGAAYVFERTGTEWSLVAELLPHDVETYLHFGEAVSLSGDVAVVGAPDDDDLGEATGSAYVFERNGGAWSLAQKLLPADAANWSAFGSAVSVLDETLAVGALADDGAATNAGAAYVFERSGGVWEQRAKLVALDASQLDWCGNAVSVSDGPCLVGARGTGAGQAYVHDLDCRFSFSVHCTCGAGAPCSNADPAAGCANSTGNGARLEATSQSTNGVLADDLVLKVEGLPPGVNGLVYMGPNTDCVTFGDGLRAVQPGPPGPGYLRFEVHTADPGGRFSEGPGLVAYADAHFGPAGAITPGSTWRFQGFYRDPLGPCGAGFNLTNGLSVTFAP